MSVGAASAVYGAQPFSHGTHLALKLQCAACHPAAANSTKIDDNLLPRPDACAKCHKSVTIGTPRGTNLARFNHELHLQAGNTCESCHTRQDLAVPPARGALTRMAMCLGCHTKVDPPDSCAFCHPKEANLKPASHTQDFLDSHTSGKLALDKATCAVCHGRHFRCMGCH